MAQQPTPLKPTDAIPDYDALVEQLTTMRAEMTRLAKSVSASAKESGQAIAQDLSEGAVEARKYVTKKGHEADKRISTSVAENPYMALGLAAGLGLLLGVLSRR